MQLNDWIVSTRFSSRWSILTRIVTGFVGVSSKFWSQFLNKSQVHNADRLLDLINNRPKGKPLITICNHDACCDDPLIFGASIPISYFLTDLKKFRWTLGAKEICFSRPWHSLFFRMGQVLPIVRGGGIYQPIMNEILCELNKGAWLHIFPEGKINMEKEQLRLKWGVGRLISDAVETPIVLPFYHHGSQEICMETILANYPPYVPQINKKTTIVYGEPIYFDEMVQQLKSEKKTPEEIRKAITDRIQADFYKLREDSLQAHLAHLDAGKKKTD